MAQRFCASYDSRLSSPQDDNENPLVFKADAEGVAAFEPVLAQMLGRTVGSLHALNFYVYLTEVHLDQVTNLFSLIQKSWAHLLFCGGVPFTGRERPISTLWGHRGDDDSTVAFAVKVNRYLSPFDGRVSYQFADTPGDTVHEIGLRVLKPGASREVALCFLYRFLNLCAWIESHTDIRLSGSHAIKWTTFEAITKNRERGVGEGSRARMEREREQQRAAEATRRETIRRSEAEGRYVPSRVQVEEIDDMGEGRAFGLGETPGTRTWNDPNAGAPEDADEEEQ